MQADIQFFLLDKTHWMDFRLENAKADFGRIWRRLGAEGDLQAAVAEWDMSYNASADCMAGCGSRPRTASPLVAIDPHAVQLETVGSVFSGAGQDSPGKAATGPINGNRWIDMLN